MAISSWLEMGISQKMDNDIRTSSAFRGHFDDTAFWKKKKGYEKAILTLKHVFPSLIVLAFGIALSIIGFIWEIMHLCKNRGNFEKQISEKITSSQHTATNTTLNENITKEADNHTIMVLADIHNRVSNIE